MARIGFIGLGNMGGGMAANLAKKGHDVRAFDISAEALDRAKAAGCLPVGDKDRLVGFITDRDITVRAVAEGKGPDAKVSDIMSREIRYCYDDQDVAEVARNMAELGVRRLPVVNRDKRIVGFVALSNIAQADSDGAKETLLRGVATPH